MILVIKKNRLAEWLSALNYSDNLHRGWRWLITDNGYVEKNEYYFGVLYYSHLGTKMVYFACKENKHPDSTRIKNSLDQLLDEFNHEEYPSIQSGL